MPLFRSSPAPVLARDSKTGEALYPYAPSQYREMHIVGHLFENGQYLPVKIFVAPEMTRPAQTRIWERMALRRAFWRGMGIASIGWALLAGLALLVLTP
jgi:hypothetical protein